MSRKILVVTHDQELETTLRCEIENEIRVCSRENAREEADNWLPQIIIVDTALPGKDSYKLCRTLSQLNQLEPPSLVFLSEEMNNRSLSSAYKAGVNYYILKQGEYQNL
jgi:two-component system alkaline phosphatase synthesis response regulator PhoP